MPMTTTPMLPQERSRPDYRMSVPPGAGPWPAILVLGGADGGIAYADSLAARLAKRGYLVMALAYFRHGDLPDKLVEIPLEYFEDALALLRDDARYDRRRGIGIYAVSKGAEAALLLAGRNADIRAIVAAGPTDVVWESPHKSADARNRSSWSLGGWPLPFVPIERTPGASSLLWHERGLDIAGEREEVREAARIPVERMNAAVQLLSAGRDNVWPTRFMADRMMRRMSRNGYSHFVEHFCAPDAGHNVYRLFRPTDLALMAVLIRLFGGTYAANRAAQKRNWPRSLAFFDRHLTPR